MSDHNGKNLKSKQNIGTCRKKKKNCRNSFDNVTRDTKNYKEEYC